MRADGRRIGDPHSDRLLIEDLSFSLPPGGIVGKTTLFRTILGEEKLDQGSLALGENARLGPEAIEPHRLRYRPITR